MGNMLFPIRFVMNGSKKWALFNFSGSTFLSSWTCDWFSYSFQAWRCCNCWCSCCKGATQIRPQLFRCEVRCLIETGFVNLPLLQFFVIEALRRKRCIVCRTIEEFQEGHIENAQNVPYMFKTQEGDQLIMCMQFISSLYTTQILAKSFGFWLFPGRAKNPEFITQVSALFKKDDPLVVVNWLLFISIFFTGKRENLRKTWIFDWLFLIKGCKSGVRSLKACVDLLNSVSYDKSC